MKNLCTKPFWYNDRVNPELRQNSKIVFWTSWIASLALFLFPFQVHEGLGLGLDKAVHFVIFAVLGFYGVKSYREKIYHTLVLLAFYALVIEYVQGRYLPGRVLDWYDAVAGIIGLAVIFLHQRKRS